MWAWYIETYHMHLKNWRNVTSIYRGLGVTSIVANCVEAWQGLKLKICHFMSSPGKCINALLKGVVPCGVDVRIYVARDGLFAGISLGR